MKTKYRKAKTLKDLRNHPYVGSVEIESGSEWIGNNGKEYDKTYWLYLKEGYCFTGFFKDEGSIRHEATIKDLLNVFYSQRIVKVK